MTYTTDEMLLMLLINKGESFNSSYNLCKILSRFFNIVDCNYLLAEIRNKKIVSFELINGVEYYKLTSSSTNYLEHTKIICVAQVKAKYETEQNRVLISAL
jgi:hypothetical protein